MLENKIALFAGIGRLGVQAAEQLAKDGWKLAISYRAGSGSQKTVDDLIKKLGEDVVLGINASISKMEEAQNFVNRAFEKYGTVRHRTPECEYFKSMYPFLMRWLSFDTKALDFFNRRYFGLNNEKVELLGYPFLPD